MQRYKHLLNRILLLGTVFLFVNMQNSFSEIVVLKNGRRINGDIVGENETTIMVKSALGTFKINRDTISEIMKEGPLSSTASEKNNSELENLDKSKIKPDNYQGIPQPSYKITGQDLLSVYSLKKTKGEEGEVLLSEDIPNEYGKLQRKKGKYG